MQKTAFGLAIAVGVVVLGYWIVAENREETARQQARELEVRTRPRSDGTVAWAKVPWCRDGWSNEVPLVAGRTVSWNFGAKRHELVNGKWVRPKFVPAGARVNALRFCANYGKGVRWQRLYWDGEEGFGGQVKKQLKPKRVSKPKRTPRPSRVSIPKKAPAPTRVKTPKRVSNPARVKSQTTRNRPPSKALPNKKPRQATTPDLYPPEPKRVKKANESSVPPLKYELDNFGWGGKFPPPGISCSAYGLPDRPTYFNGKPRVACGN